MMLEKLSLLTTLAYYNMSPKRCRSLAEVNVALSGGHSPSEQIRGVHLPATSLRGQGRTPAT